MALARCSWQLSPLSSLAKSGFFVGLWVLVKGWQCSLLNHHSNFPSPTEQSKTAVCAGKNSHAGLFQLFQLADDEQLTSGWLCFFFYFSELPMSKSMSMSFSEFQSTSCLFFLATAVLCAHFILAVFADFIFIFFPSFFLYFSLHPMTSVINALLSASAFLLLLLPPLACFVHCLVPAQQQQKLLAALDHAPCPLLGRPLWNMKRRAGKSPSQQAHFNLSVLGDCFQNWPAYFWADHPKELHWMAEFSPSSRPQTKSLLFCPPKQHWLVKVLHEGQLAAGVHEAATATGEENRPLGLAAGLHLGHLHRGDLWPPLQCPVRRFCPRLLGLSKFLRLRSVCGQHSGRAGRRTPAEGGLRRRDVRTGAVVPEVGARGIQGECGDLKWHLHGESVLGTCENMQVFERRRNRGNALWDDFQMT